LVFAFLLFKLPVLNVTGFESKAYITYYLKGLVVNFINACMFYFDVSNFHNLQLFYLGTE